MSDHPQRQTSDPTLVDQPLPLPASERTLIDSPSDALTDARSRTIGDRPTSDRLVPQPTSKPVIPDPGIESLLNPAAPKENRYAIGTLLGTGSSSHVYAGHDRTFDREVAIKFLETGLAQDARRLSRFVREARMTARLDHPNIVPVYDLDATPAGDLYLTMRQVKGLSLGDAVRRAAAGDLPPELGDLNRRVNILLKVCDALACAHDRGIAHLDVKPDNIMLGPFGEVVLVDWGLARCFDEEPRARQHISGTPAYMSPEQSAGHPGDALADIYCLGATLFHVLTLRHPTWGTDEAEFWAKKRAGTIDPPTAKESANIPKQLLAIALKALACDRGDRYASVNALGEDLQHYQAGLAVSAYRESRLERAIRWHRRHARPLWMGVGAAVAVIASALYVYGERLKEVVAWGAPVYRQGFADDSWRADFSDVNFSTDFTDVVNQSRWERQDGRIVSIGTRQNYLFLQRRIYGPVAVEVEGEMLLGQPPCDLSLAWSAKDPSSDPDWWRETYLLQTGASDNTFAGISYNFREALTWVPVRLVPGVRYRLRFEIDDDRLSIDIDGKRICEYRASFPCTSGFIGIYGFYPGKAFDNLVVYTKSVPQRISPTAIGDSWYQRDQPLEAATQYRLVAETFPGTKLGDQARFKQGMCFAKLDRRAEALALWESLHDRTVVNLAECVRIEWANDKGDIAEAVDRFTALYQSEPSLRPRLHLIFAEAVKDASFGEKPELTDLWLSLTRDLLPSDPSVDEAAAVALNQLGREEVLLARYPQVENQAALALRSLGRHAEMLARYPQCKVWLKRDALLNLGRLDEIVREIPSTYGSNNSDIFSLQGRYDELLAASVDADQRRTRRIMLGRSAEVLAESEPGTFHWYMAMIHLGRHDEALAAERADAKHPTMVRLRCRQYDEILAEAKMFKWDVDWQVFLGRWIAALERNDGAVAAEALSGANLPAQQFDCQSPWFIRLIGVEFVRAFGDKGTFATAMRALVKRGPGWQVQRPWHAARYLLGEIDEATFLAQPARSHAPAALLILRAMRAELEGERLAARADYRAYLTLPLHLRSWDALGGDPIVDHFAAWRLAELGN